MENLEKNQVLTFEEFKKLYAVENCIDYMQEELELEECDGLLMNKYNLDYYLSFDAEDKHWFCNRRKGVRYYAFDIWGKIWCYSKNEAMRYCYNTIKDYGFNDFLNFMEEQKNDF